MTRKYTALFFTALTLIAFQNCSPVSFQNDESSASKAGDPVGGEFDDEDKEYGENTPISDDEDAELDTTLANCDARNNKDVAAGTVEYASRPVNNSAKPASYTKLRVSALDVDTELISAFTNIRSNAITVSTRKIAGINNIRGANQAYDAVEFGNISNIRGNSQYYAGVTIAGFSNVRSDRMFISANSIDSISNGRFGHNCVSAEEIGPINNIRAGRILLAGPATGGTIESIENMRSGFLVLRNMKVNSIKNFRGRIFLENSEVLAMENVRGEVFLKNASVGTRFDVKDTPFTNK